MPPVVRQWFFRGVHRRFVVSHGSRITAASTEVEPVKTVPVVLGADTSAVPRTALASVLIGASVAETGTKKGMTGPGASHSFYVRLIES